MQNQQEPEISVFEAWEILRRGWMAIAITTAVFTVLGLAIATVMPSNYVAEVVIKEAESSATPMPARGGGLLGQLGGLAALAGMDGAGAGRRTSGMMLLRSRTFGEEFIRRHDLLPELFHSSWDEERNDWPEGYVPPAPSTAAPVFAKVFSVGESREVPGAISLTVRWRDPVLAAEWANGLVELVNEMARQRDITEAERSVAYLNEQISETNVVELQRVLFSLLEQEQKTLMLANAREFYAFEVIDPAIVPLYPASPNRPQVIAAGVIAGIFFGLLIVFLRAVVRSWRREQGR